jgi:inosose dehydratase
LGPPRRSLIVMMNPEHVRIAIAPIGWTNDDLPELGGEIPFEQCVSEMALAGYAGCEIGGKFPRDPSILRPQLDLRGLRVCNAWFSSFLTTKSLDENVIPFRLQCSFLRDMGATVIGISEQGHSVQGDPKLPVYDAKPIFGPSDWKRLHEGIAVLARHAAEYGITVAYHHHMGTGVQTVAETRILLDGVDAEALSLLFDTGHFAMSGEHPVDALEEFFPRVRHIHLKDVRMEVATAVRRERMSFLDAVRAGVFTVPGDGGIDFDPVFALLERGGYRGWMVVEAEQDPAKANPLEYAMKGRSFIRAKTGL